MLRSIRLPPSSALVRAFTPNKCSKQLLHQRLLLRNFDPASKNSLMAYSTFTHPRVGVSVAVFRDPKNPYNMNVATADSWDILLIKRGKEPAKGNWSVPGGSLNLGETLAEGGKREVLEETGLDVNVGDVMSTIEAIHKDESGQTKFHYVLIDLVGTCADPNAFHPIASDDAEDARWVPVQDLATIGPLTDGLQQVIEKGIKLLQAGFLSLPMANVKT